MRYATSITLTFPATPKQLFGELTDLRTIDIWNAGMVTVEGGEVMRQGERFKTVSVVIGKKIASSVRVVRLVPGEELELANESGGIHYVAQYKLTPKSADTTELLCSLQFELTGIVLNFAHSVIESMAHARIKADLETLRELIKQKYHTSAT